MATVSNALLKYALMWGEVANDARHHRDHTLKWTVLLTGHFVGGGADGALRSAALPLASPPRSKNNYYPFLSPHSAASSALPHLRRVSAVFSHLFHLFTEIFQKQWKLPSSYKRIQYSGFKAQNTSSLLIFPGSRFLFYACT